MTRLPGGRMIRLLAPPPPPVSNLSLFPSLPCVSQIVLTDRRGGKGVGEEPDCTRKPGHLEIIQYSPIFVFIETASHSFSKGQRYLRSYKNIVKLGTEVSQNEKNKNKSQSCLTVPPKCT